MKNSATKSETKSVVGWFLRSVVQSALLLGAGLLVIVALGIAQKQGWISAAGGGAAPAAGGAEVVYTCPMHPQIRQPSPGRCPICGMALEPATSGGGQLDELSVTISPAARRVANIATAEATRVPLERTIRTVGSITFDESRLATIAAYVAGRIERMYADYTGVRVEKGDHLVVLFSPELYKAQVDLLESKRSLPEMLDGALPNFIETQKRLIEDSRHRLIELGMTEEQVAELERADRPESRLTIYAPLGGTVIAKEAVEGQDVRDGQTIYRIADLSTVWLMLEVFPEDVAQIRFGQQVRAEVQSLPGQTVIGRIAFIDPIVDPKTRTVSVRVEMLNADGRLRPGDYATAAITIPIGSKGEVYDAGLAGKWISPMHPQIIRDEPGDCPVCGMKLIPTSRFGYAEHPVPQTESLVVPRSAVLLAGKNSVVYVEVEPGRFEVRPVTLGPFTDQYAVILGGLKAGEAVAISGNFLIDSQMQLAGKPSLIDPTKALVRKSAPLELEHIHVEPIAGAPGRTLEELYAAYFATQATLAADREVSESEANALHGAAEKLASDRDVPESLVEAADTIAKQSEHLHHQGLAKARLAFRPISQAIVRLAAHARGDDAKTRFLHFFCPMVKDGGGDWLQANEPLANPYFGAEMLRCGEKVHELPARGHAENDAEGDGESGDTDT